MPTSLTESDAFTTPVVAPNDTEVANAASLTQGLQPLTNRTKYLREQIFTRGAVRFRQGSAATMAALTGVTDGEAFQVYSGATEQGIYIYDADGTQTADSFFVYTATGMGVGRWVHEAFSLLNTTPGFAKIDAAGKILSTVTPNRIVAAYQYLNGAGAFNTTSIVAVDITGFTLAVPSCLVGDKLQIQWIARCYMSASNGTFVPAIVDGTDTSPFLVSFDAATANSTPIVVPTIWTVANAGTITVKGKLASGNVAWTANAVGPWSIDVLHIRP